jgi:predicted amino acid-binding ACT domain protein
MPYDISRADVWAGEVDEQPGALARTLLRLHDAGVNLESAVLRPAAPLSNAGVLFVAPLATEPEVRAAHEAGLHKTGSIHAVRIAGPDRPGLVADIARGLSEAEIHVCGLSSTAIEGRSVHYVRFASAADADQAVDLLRTQLPASCTPKDR